MQILKALRHVLKHSLHPTDKMGIFFFILFAISLYGQAFRSVGGAWGPANPAHDPYAWMLALTLSVIVFGILTYYVIEKRYWLSMNHPDQAEAYIQRYIDQTHGHHNDIDVMRDSLLKGGYTHVLVDPAIVKHAKKSAA
ncbi:MAG: hypothetical protein ABIH41_05515 [Nanoarchaeota archaeon]